VARRPGGVLIWGAAYAAALAALFVRVRTAADTPPPSPVDPPPGEPLWLTRLHHALFVLLLAGAPLERLVAGGAAPRRATGLALLAAGVALYRTAGRALGDALSPFIEPRAGAPLVTDGIYRHLRHPIYLGEALIAVGAPLTLGCRWTLAISVLALAVLGVRIAFEDEALARTFPEYPRYAATTKRLVPFLY
jgi:protein-S-isoprenylcysteine O-methyltransferase Ste14